MKLLRLIVLSMSCTLAVVAGRARAQVRVTAQVDTSKPIYVGEPFAYHVVIEGDNRPGEVDISPLAGYSPEKAGARDLSQRSTIIVNGRRTENVSKRYVMSYQLTAGEVGVLRLPPVSVTLANKVYKTNAVNVRIAEPGKTEKMEIQLDFSETRCYVGQPLVMTVKWYIWTSEAGSVGNFQFNVPALGSGLFYVEDTDESLQSRNRNSRKVNGLPVTLFQRQIKHNGVDSLEVFFNKVLIPKQSGSIEIKPATISADIAEGPARRRRNSLFDNFFAAPRQYKRFVARSKPAMLEVLPVPTEGKPEDFYGLVGEYTIAASATPTEVNVGDPVTLKIKIGGTRYLKPVQMPDLTAITGMVENFKISTEQASSVIENGFRVFTQTIRAKNDNVAEIPPIGLSYFDASKGKYATVRTRPVKLKVAPTRIVTESDIEGNDFTVFGKSVELVKIGISAHFEGLEALQDEYFSPAAALVSPGYALLWGAPLGIVILSALAKLFTHSTPEKIAARRRRSAFANARKAVRKTAKHPDSEASQLLAAAMKQYAADKFGRVAGSLTAADCFDLIMDAISDSATASDYKKVMESCEASAYSPTEVKYKPALAKKVIAMMRTIEKGTKR